MMDMARKHMGAALPLTALLGASLLAGCGDGKDNTTVDNPPASNPAVNGQTQQPAPPAPGGPSGTMMNKPSSNPNGVPGDMLITAKVKSAIIADTKVGAKDVNVDTKSGVVVLRGNVHSAAAKAAAGADAQKMQGVTKVTNQLTVNPKM